jgi:cell filamentation protein, protein adenylyltransferase
MRQYERTHPWLAFTFDPGRLSHLDWMRLGEALSKCDHIAGVPLLPAVAADLHEIYLAKGIHATTQIEGNTLTEDEARRRIAGDLPLPESQEYLGIEIDNILAVCQEIYADLAAGAVRPLDAAQVKAFNASVLADLALADDVVPGETRTHSVVVNGYRGAPAEDCDYLLERLCTWLAGLCDCLPPELHRPMRIIRAVLAHLYLAWIHPFGDGNGRTARLMEFQLLLEAGLPTPACHLLSNYYNRTRSRYYAVLAQTSRPPYPVEVFVAYAVQGFVEELREQLATIRYQQLLVAWVNYVHEQFDGAPTPARRRQRDLVLSLPFDRPTPTARIARLTPDLAVQYATKQHKTVVRDVNELLRMNLVERTASGVRPLIEQLAAFLPLRRP